MNPLDEQIQEFQSLLQDLLQGIQDILQSGELLSDEFQGEVARTLNLLTDRIDGLMEERNTQVAAPITPPLEPSPFASAQVNSFKYDPDSQDLYVKFQGDYPQENGPTYVYNKIPKFIYELFQRGAVGPKTTGSNAWHAWKKDTLPSLGAALNALIKGGGYQYQRLT